MPYMYILECVDGSFYTGSTRDLPRRLWQHENGMGARHTSKRLPVRLVYAAGDYLIFKEYEVLKS
jgi:putative endonuclease